MNEVMCYTLIPQDLIRYSRIPVNGLMHITIDTETGSELDNNPVMRNIPLSDEELLTFNNGTIELKIKIITLDETQRNFLKDNFSIKILPFQIGFKVTIKAEDVHSMDVQKFESEIRHYLILSMILANKDMQIVYHDPDHSYISEFSNMDANGQGVFLPYSFIKLTEDGYINTFYQSDYDRTVIKCGRYFSLFNQAKINILKELLRKFITNEDRPIKDPTIDMFIHCHTFSWIPKGLLYSAVVTLFGCFDSLLTKEGRIALCNSDSLLKRFEAFRNAISHLDGHTITYNNGIYTATQYRSLRGDLPSPIVTTINIDEIEEVRKKLIEKIIERVLPSSSI